MGLPPAPEAAHHSTACFLALIGSFSNPRLPAQFRVRHAAGRAERRALRATLRVPALSSCPPHLRLFSAHCRWRRRLMRLHSLYPRLPLPPFCVSSRGTEQALREHRDGMSAPPLPPPRAPQTPEHLHRLSPACAICACSDNTMQLDADGDLVVARRPATDSVSEALAACSVRLLWEPPAPLDSFNEKRPRSQRRSVPHSRLPPPSLTAAAHPRHRPTRAFSSRGRRRRWC